MPIARVMALEQSPEVFIRSDGQLEPASVDQGQCREEALIVDLVLPGDWDGVKEGLPWLQRTSDVDR